MTRRGPSTGAAAALLLAAVALAAGTAGALDAFEGSNLPVLVLHTASDAVPSFTGGEFVAARLDILDSGGDNATANRLGDAPALTVPVRVQRGPHNTQAEPAKPNYSLVGRADFGSNAEGSFAPLGMPADVRWSLQGMYADRSLLHNSMAYRVAEAAGVAVPRHAFVEVFLVASASSATEDAAEPAANATHYMGLFLLREEVTRSASRVDVEELLVGGDPEKGGWIFHMGADAGEPSAEFVAGSDAKMARVDYPGTADETQLKFLQEEVLDDAQEALYLLSEFNSTRDLWRCSPGYRSALDEESLVGAVVTNEMSFGPDEYATHAYFSRRAGGKVVAGPMTDFEFGFGVVALGSPREACCQGADGGLRWGEDLGVPWFTRVHEDPVFRCRVREAFMALRAEGEVLHADEIASFVNNQTAVIADAAARNAEQWELATVPPAAPTVVEGANQGVYKDHLITFARERAAWLESKYTEVIGSSPWCADPAAEYVASAALCKPLEEEYGNPAATAAPGVAAALLAVAAALAAARM